jgi:hypothetical protein
MIKTKTRLFNVSSANALNTSFKSQVNIQLPDLAFHDFNIQNVYLSVSHCEVPNSFYIINYTNNQIVVDSVTYIIPVGNYNVNSFITICQSILPAGFTITYSSINNKFTFKNNLFFTINGSSSSSTINKVIGLDNNDYISYPAGFGQELELPHVVNFLPMQRINFKSNFFKFNNYNSSDGSSDVFLCLQNNAGQLSMINYVNQSNDEYLIQDRNITSFIINVTDDYNNLINFNNIDWTLSFKIKIEYMDKTDINQNFYEILKNQTISI